MSKFEISKQWEHAYVSIQCVPFWDRFATIKGKPMESMLTTRKHWFLISVVCLERNSSTASMKENIHSIWKHHKEKNMHALGDYSVLNVIEIPQFATTWYTWRTQITNTEWSYLSGICKCWTHKTEEECYKRLKSTWKGRSLSMDRKFCF